MLYIFLTNIWILYNWFTIPIKFREKSIIFAVSSSDKMKLPSISNIKMH